MGGEESKVNVRVRGMTCPACELRIESALLKKPGVQAVNADYRRGAVQVVGGFAANGAKMLEEELERLGYAVSDGEERNGSGAKAWLKAMLAAAAVATTACWTSTRLSSRITGSSIGSGRSGKRPLARPSATPRQRAKQAGKLIALPEYAPWPNWICIATPPLLMALCRLPSWWRVRRRAARACWR